jgi:hypothetical protein
MKRLLITLMLISPFSFADWGDVYYCQMTTNSGTTPEGERADYKLEKFTFKLDKTKNAMVFGKGGLFKNIVSELRTGMSFPSIESWYAINEFAMARFNEGRLAYSMVSNTAIVSISADCDKF